MSERFDGKCDGAALHSALPAVLAAHTGSFGSLLLSEAASPALCKVRLSKTSPNSTTNTELQSNIWMMYIKPPGEFSVCNHRVTEQERIKHKAIPVFLKSLKYRKGPKESLF